MYISCPVAGLVKIPLRLFYSRFAKAGKIHALVLCYCSPLFEVQHFTRSSKIATANISYIYLDAVAKEVVFIPFNVVLKIYMIHAACIHHLRDERDKAI